MNTTKKTAILEVLLYVTGEEGITAEQIGGILEISNEEVLELIEDFKEILAKNGRGLALVEVAGTFQLITKPEFSGYIKKLVDAPKPSSLSQAALETLAVIAYKQPVSRADVEEVRGVKSEKALQTLVTKGLIKEVGRVEGTGRAILYGVTGSFLSHFGLKSMDELPPMPEPEEQTEDEETDLFYRESLQFSPE